MKSGMSSMGEARDAISRPCRIRTPRGSYGSLLPDNQVAPGRHGEANVVQAGATLDGGVAATSRQKQPSLCSALRTTVTDGGDQVRPLTVPRRRAMDGGRGRPPWDATVQPCGYAVRQPLQSGWPALCSAVDRAHRYPASPLASSPSSTGAAVTLGFALVQMRIRLRIRLSTRHFGGQRAAPRWSGCCR